MITYRGTGDNEFKFMVVEIFAELHDALYCGIVSAREVLRIEDHCLGGNLIWTVLHHLVLYILHTGEFQTLVRLYHYRFSGCLQQNVSD